MIATTVILLGVLAWVLVAILLALFLGRVNRLRRLSRPQASVVEPSPAPPVREMIPAPPAEAIRLPSAPPRFVGRAKVIGAASTALAPAS